MNKPPTKQNIFFELFGWILFVVCALLFLASSIQNRDTILIYASLVFLIACFVFMIPLIKGLINNKK